VQHLRLRRNRDDIEGPTLLLKQLRERYSSVVAEHRRILREAIAAHGGSEIDNQGDSFFVAGVGAA
jgi:class 3 adenylate cyclase